MLIQQEAIRNLNDHSDDGDRHKVRCGQFGFERYLITKKERTSYFAMTGQYNLTQRRSITTADRFLQKNAIPKGIHQKKMRNRNSRKHNKIDPIGLVPTTLEEAPMRRMDRYYHSGA